MKLNFDKKTHGYTLDGLQVFSVTQAIQEAGIYNLDMIDKYTLDFAAKRGTAVHCATELWDNKKLNITKLDKVLVPYLESWKKFLNDFKVEIIENEKKIFSKKYRYAGTLDRIGSINGEERLTVIDIKSGMLCDWHALQVAAYEQAYRETTKTRQRLKRMTVQLKPEGYKIIEYENKNDLNVFLAALTIANWKNK